MKKLFLASAFALFGAVNAQEYKPTTGDVTVDFGLAGGLGATSISLPDQGFDAGAMFKGRYFTSEQFAYRGTLVIDNESAKNNNKFALGLGFGVEKHFTGTDRLSPYVGGDVMLKLENQKVANVSSSNFGFGLRGVFGADYYFAKRVFLGVEAGLGFMYSDPDGKDNGKFLIKPAVVTGVRLGYAF